MTTPIPSLIRSSLIALLFFGILACTATQMAAAPDPSQSASTPSASAKYKLISGFKGAFNDALQLELSKGWTPVGGVSVTVWNSDLYFAQLISKPASE